jgi:hypothetical protein
MEDVVELRHWVPAFDADGHEDLEGSALRVEDLRSRAWW